MVFGISRQKETCCCPRRAAPVQGLDTEGVWFMLPGEITPSKSKLVLKSN